MGRRPPYVVWVTAAAVGVFQVGGSFGAADGQPDRRGMDAAAVALLLVGPAGLARRDRHPLLAVALAAGAADVYVGSGYAYGPVFASVIIALFAAVQAGHRARTWALAGAAYAGLVAAQLVDARTEELSLVHLTLVAGWLAVVLTGAEVWRNRRERAAEQERLARDEERLRLAQELHDVLAHNISLINVQASVALHLLDDDPSQAGPALATIKAASHDSLQELRTALDVLRHGDGAPRSPARRVADLDELVTNVRAGGLAVDMDVDTEGPLPAAVELAAYRIVQEALTNVTRHARARRADVRVECDGDDLTIEVVDDGSTSATTPLTPGNGITGMRERATALGGTLDAGPTPAGFRVAARLPIR